MNILVAAAFRCSHLCLSFMFFFLVKMMRIYFGKPIFRGRSLFLKCFQRIWSYAHRCLVHHVYSFFFVNFNGIDDFAGGFTFKVDYWNSSNIMFKLSMLQKAPKRRSPNTFNYKFK